MKAYFGKEAREYQQINPKDFEKSFESYKRSLQLRIKTFEKHGKTKSQSVKRLREALYDVENAYTESEKASAFSRASFVLTSARGSFTRSRELDRKIVASLNEEFSIRDPETGEIIKPFITLSELEDFGEMMEEAKEASKTNLYSSSQVARTIRGIIKETGGKPVDWRSLLDEYLDSKKYFEDEGV